MLEKFDRFNRTVSQAAELMGLGALLLMVGLTCVDVLGTKLFRLPVPGSLDIMMLAQVVAISFAAAMALIQGRHIEVEFVTMLLPRRGRALLACVVKLLSLVLFVSAAWHLFVYGQHMQAGGEVTPTVRISMAPFAYACSAAMIPVCLVLLQQFLDSALRVVRHES